MWAFPVGKVAKHYQANLKQMVCHHPTNAVRLVNRHSIIEDGINLFVCGPEPFCDIFIDCHQSVFDGSTISLLSLTKQAIFMSPWHSIHLHFMLIAPCSADLNPVCDWHQVCQVSAGQAEPPAPTCSRLLSQCVTGINFPLCLYRWSGPKSTAEI